MRILHWKSRLLWVFSTLINFCALGGAFITVELFLKGNFSLEGLQNFPHISRNVPQQLDKNLHTDIERGSIKLKTWFDTCGTSFEEALQHPLFPNYPHQEERTSSLQITTQETNYLQWITGYITPPETGYYQFAISSDDNSELWFSTEENKETQLIARVGTRDEIAWGQSGKYFTSKTQVSKPFLLKYGQDYPVDILFYQAVGIAFLEVAWLVPGSTEFDIIEGKFLSYNRSDEGVHTDMHKFDIHPQKFSVSKPKTHLVHILNFKPFGDVLPLCTVEKMTPKRLGLVQEPTSYSEKQKWNKAVENVPGEEYILQTSKVKKLSEALLQAILKKYPLRYKIVSTYLVEEVLVSDSTGRYLIELLLEVDGVDYSERFIEYVMADTNSINVTNLCYPKNSVYRWNKEITVNIIIAVKNKGMLFEALINNLARIYEETVDLDMNVIIADFHTKVVDLQKIKKKSSLDKISVVEISGYFSLARGVNEAVKTIKEENSIVLVIQLGTILPASLIEDARKHCLEGTMAYAPIPLFRKCSGQVEPNLSWGSWDVPVFGMHKADWFRVGGMQEQATRQDTMTTMVHRAVKFDIEVSRQRRKDLYIAFREDD